MTGAILTLIIIHAILFSFIFWLLTFVAKLTYSNNYFNYKLNFYECGFKNLTKKKISYELNYIMLILFLVLYDGEFLILIPFSFNASITVFEVSLIIFIFIVWLVITLLFDYVFGALDWQI